MAGDRCHTHNIVTIMKYVCVILNNGVHIRIEGKIQSFGTSHGSATIHCKQTEVNISAIDRHNHDKPVDWWNYNTSTVSSNVKFYDVECVYGH